MVYSESVLRHTPGMAPLQRLDSSNAPEPLHILHASAEIVNELDLPDLSCDAPEPVRLPSSSTQAPEHMHGKNQDIAGELFRPVYSSSQEPGPVSFTTTTDLNERAHKAIDAWARRDFVAAARLLEEQLAAVEQGFVAPNGLQPDRRVLRHCIGVCASFSGDLTKAKQFFESAFNGICLFRNLDGGAIAAARWLGDVCLRLREFHNTVLAWSVALEGSIRRFGLSHDRTWHISQEMLKLNEWVSAFEGINSRFRGNVDPTDIFSNTHTLKKSDLVRAIQVRVNERRQIRIGHPSAASGRVRAWKRFQERHF